MGKERYFRSIRGLYRIVISIILISLIYAIGVSIYQKNYLLLFISVLTLVLASLPFFVRRLKIKIPIEIELISILFIYATIFLGEAQNFYLKFWWWDNLLHGGSSIVFGFIGFTILYFMVSRHNLKARPWAIAIFSFSFAIAIGVLWEIFEFSIDSFFGLNMQKSGLRDTMTDLIVDTIGAILSSTVAFIYLKSKKTLIFGKIVENN